MVLLFLWKLDSKNYYQILRSFRAHRFQENHYPRSTKSTVNKRAQNPPKEKNSCTLLTGKLYLPPNTASVTLSWNTVLKLQNLPSSGTWSEMAEPPEGKRVSENNPGSGTGTWVLVSVPPLTLNLSQWFLLPCMQVSNPWNELNTTIFLSLSINISQDTC